MGLFSSLRGELIDIIEWLNDKTGTLVHRFERHDNEIKNNAKLIVRESQVAVFVNEGKFADVFTPGTYTLSTQNLPILSTLKGWKYGFDSPFKAEVYFVNMAKITDMGWGTPQPIMMRDPDFDMVKLRATGTYCFKIVEPQLFITSLSGTEGNYTSDQVADTFRNQIIPGISDTIASSKIGVMDISSHYDELSEAGELKLQTRFDKYGVKIFDFVIESVSFPDDFDQILRKRAEMKNYNVNYQTLQQGESMENISNNPGGGGVAGDMMGMGMGFGMANSFVNQNQNQNQNQQQNQAPQNTQSAPPPLPQTMKKYHVVLEGNQRGPLSTDEIKGLIQAGNFTQTTMVWKEGLPQWQTANTIDEVNALFGSIPPPLPI